MVQSGGLDFGRTKESHKTEANRCKIRETKKRDGKMSPDKRIGKLKDRLGWIRENGLRRLQKKLKMRLNSNT